MQYELTGEQRAFRDACGRLATDLAAGWHRGRGPGDVDPPNPDEKAWARMVDAGWLALGLTEANGGVGASVVDISVLVEQLGYHSVAAPIVGSLIAAEQLQTWGAPVGFLEEVAAGTVRVAPALTPRLRDFAVSPDAAIAWDAALADICVVPTTGTAHALGDPLPYADVTRSVRPLTTLVDAPPLTAPTDSDRLPAFALSLLTADLLGTAQAALDAAVAHAKVRHQFGAPIGSFQAVQQLLADSYVLVEASRSAALRSAWAVDHRPGAEALHIARTAKAFVSRSSVEVCEHAIQVFGGIGMTWEAPAHIWLRRAYGDRTALGNEHHHQSVLANEAGS